MLKKYQQYQDHKLCLASSGESMPRLIAIETNCNRHHRFNEICVGFCYLCNALSATFFNPANDAIRLYNTCWVLVLFLLAEAKID